MRRRRAYRDWRAGVLVAFIHAAVLGVLPGCAATPDESRMSATVLRADSLLQELAAREPVGYNPGTPELSESEEVEQLVQIGAAIVPHLIDRTRSDRSQELAYVALVLGRIGDARAFVAACLARPRSCAREQGRVGLRRDRSDQRRHRAARAAIVAHQVRLFWVTLPPARAASSSG
jgi:hypothetical protein